MFKSLVTLVLVLVSTVVFAGQVSLMWDANTQPELSGYKMYWSKTSGPPYEYNKEVNKSETSTDIPFLENGVEWFFAVTAFSSSGSESDYSNEVSTVVEEGSIQIILEKIENLRIEINQ